MLQYSSISRGILLPTRGTLNILSHEFQQQRLIDYARVSKNSHSKLILYYNMGANVRTSSVTNSRVLKQIDWGFYFAKKVCDVEILSLYGCSTD
ncbi:hypothetical protein Enr10x_04260 [Gimesia panareensis]|uniref:Uncharacterized protein n=1 Tax=Gimesia panareensis TaxID=2527978 RepID=A0A517Q0I5_9PLAN|nr:hypothetical protein Enr10x_04260 [Gimesia panareensis]